MEVPGPDPRAPLAPLKPTLISQPLWVRGQPAHTPPQRPPGAERKGRHKGRKKFSKPDCTGGGRTSTFNHGLVGQEFTLSDRDALFILPTARACKILRVLEKAA
eukprot:365714-Chlamydomonas_euryale.AAC.7